jgi:trehalose 6-phosphate phosphatase
VRDILARANRDVLQRFACGSVLLAFDYDGTLAPIVRDPARATMRARTRALLTDVAKKYPCLITGRARADASRRLGALQGIALIGNHGIEPWQVSVRARRSVRRWLPLLVPRLARLPGVTVEDKTYSIAIHYRGSREKQSALKVIRAAIATLGDLRVIPGKQVLNLLPRASADKGSALLQALARSGCETALYVGDDFTDEDAFALDQPGRLLSIRVGRRKDSLASYFIRSQNEIDDLLRRLRSLARARQPRGIRNGRPSPGP